MNIIVDKKNTPLTIATDKAIDLKSIKLNKIIIADLGDWVGHRPNYLKTVIRLFAHKDRSCYIISSNQEAVEKFLKLEGISNTIVLSVSFSTVEKIIFRGIGILDQIIRPFNLDKWFEPKSILQLLQIKILQRRHKISRVSVFFTSVSDLMPIVPTRIKSLLFPEKWSGIYVTPWYNTGNIFSKTARRKRAYGNQSMRLSSCQGIFVIHPSYTTYYRRLLGKNHFYAIPEPISLEINKKFSLAEKIIKKAAGRFTITLLGGIGTKRNVLLLLDALNLLNNKNWFLVIIGKLQENGFSQGELIRMRTFFQEHSDQCFIKLDEYVTIERDFNAIIDATHLMYLHYHNHPFSSNQLLKAIALRKPVIVNKGGIVETIAKDTNWSAVVPYDSEKVAASIENIQQHFTIDENAYANFMQNLDYKNLRNTILKQLETINSPA